MNKTTHYNTGMNTRQPSPWTFFTNHSHVLFYLATHPDLPLREVASAIGITERAVQKIISDLAGNGIITKVRVGRSNKYTINRHMPLRHPLEAHRSIGDILTVICKEDSI